MNAIAFNDRLMQQFQQRAHELHTTPEDLLECVVSEYLAAPTTTSTTQTTPDIDAIAQKRLIDLLFNNSTDLICLHRPDGTLIRVSASAERLGGYAEEELLGRNPYDFFHPDDLHKIQLSHEISQRGEAVNSVIYRWRKKDGSYLWLETSTDPLVDEHGDVIFLLTISRDISQRLRIQEELRQERDLLSRIMETSPSGITVVDRDGTIIFSNRRAQEIHGTPDGERRTYNAPSWRHTAYDGSPWRDEDQPFVRVMQTKQAVWDVRHAIEWSDGRIVYLAINGAPILDEHGEVGKVVFTVEDYTERKRQQDELEAALQAERKLNTLKSAFISVVSHEFRTPLTVIMTSVELLRMKQAHLTAEEYLMRLARIESQVDRLSAMLADVTFLSKEMLVGLPVTPVQIDLLQFFGQLREELAMVYPSHRPIVVEASGDCTIFHTDALLMQQIFMNLLSNAIKYSPDNSSVCCRYSCTPTTLHVTIQDFGMGIPESDQQRLFDAFYRASNVGEISGTGLGLAIVKRAVDTLGGMISFESHVGEGTTFTVVLPTEKIAVQKK